MGSGSFGTATSELRQRKQGGLLNDEDEQPKSKALRRFAQAADMFPKPKEDYKRTQSAEGGIVSAVALSLLSLLVSYELLKYAMGWDAYRTELSVDQGINAGVPFHFDITFPSIPCHELSVDAMDASGKQENNVAHDLFKSPVTREGRLAFLGHYNYVERRLGPDGMPIGPKKYDETKDPRSPKFCGECYIAPTQHHHGFDAPGGAMDKHAQSVHKDMCCNTCEKVMAFYDMHRVPRPHIFEIEQCIDEISRASPGCNLRGTLSLPKVKGNFHFAPGTGTQFGPFGQHIHTFSVDQMLRYNASHVINKFRIGDEKVERFSKRGVAFPLEGTRYTVRQGMGYVKYYLQVVPTTYRSGASASQPTEVVLDGATGAVLRPSSTEESYEYAVQHHHQEFGFGPMMTRNPSIFFVFDFHPIQVNNIFQRPPFGRTMVKLCAIVGGLFVILGFVDRAVEFALRVRNANA